MNKSRREFIQTSLGMAASLGFGATLQARPGADDIASFMLNVGKQLASRIRIARLLLLLASIDQFLWRKGHLAACRSVAQ